MAVDQNFLKVNKFFIPIFLFLVSINVSFAENLSFKKIVDLNRSEYFILSCLAAPILFYGFYPDPLINTIEVSVTDLINMHETNLASK